MDNNPLLNSSVCSERNDFSRDCSTPECEIRDKQYSDFGHSVLVNHMALHL